VDDAWSHRETRYLDLDGDGVPDAVETVERVVVGDRRAGRSRVVHELRTLSAGIGVDGVAQRILSVSTR
jgi:hypothetical protein